MPLQPLNPKRPPSHNEEQPPRPAAKTGPISKRKPFIMQKVRRQDLILLTGVLSLACFSVITVGLLIFRSQSAAELEIPVTSTPGPQPTHTVTYVQVTGLSQYRQAETAARTWAADAQLMSASTHWPRVTNENQIGQPEQWTYRFYSPAKQHLFVVNVYPDNRVWSFEHVAMITLPPPIVDTTVWSIDSPAALAIWLDYGGADLVHRNPGLEVLIQLRSLAGQSIPVWMVVGSDQRTQDILTVMVDAGQGQVILANSAR